MLKKVVACGAVFCFLSGFVALADAAGASVAAGKTLFTSNCVICHGANGMGNGPAAMSLQPKPQDFHNKAFWQTPNLDTVVFDQIKNGKGEMPAFPNLSKGDIQSIILYIKSAFKPK